jgi:hypothetical protein
MAHLMMAFAPALPGKHHPAPGSLQGRARTWDSEYRNITISTAQEATELSTLRSPWQGVRNFPLRPQGLWRNQSR